jgi:hypothetical protein
MLSSAIKPARPVPPCCERSPGTVLLLAALGAALVAG